MSKMGSQRRHIFFRTLVGTQFCPRSQRPVPLSFVVERREEIVARTPTERKTNSASTNRRILEWTGVLTSIPQTRSAANHSFMVAERGFVEQLRSSGLAKALVEEVEQFIKWCVDSCCCRRQRRDLRPLGSRTIADRVRDSKLYPPR